MKTRRAHSWPSCPRFEGSGDHPKISPGRAARSTVFHSRQATVPRAGDQLEPPVAPEVRRELHMREHSRILLAASLPCIGCSMPVGAACREPELVAILDDL